MTKPDFAGSWQVVTSTSRLFPVQAKVELERKEPRAFALVVRWEVHDLPLFEQDFPEDPPGTLRGSFCHPKKPKEEFEISLTVSRGPLDRKFLFGVVREVRGGVDPGGIGVWVAEEPPKTSKE